MRIHITVLLFASLIFVFLPTVATAEFSYLWCNNSDSVYANVDQATGVVDFYHDAAIYNCCADPAVFSITTSERTLRIEEVVTETTPCFCNCCFDLSVSVGDLAAGLWSVVYVWDDLETGVPVEVTLNIEIPVTVPVSKSSIVESFMSECRTLSSVPEQNIEPCLWGCLKGRYR